jgi:hypothetical protein
MVAPKLNSSHDVIVTTTVELIGVTLMAVIAGMSNSAGKVMVAIMVGFLFLWLITNTQFLNAIVSHV